jgi:predicted metal-dependent hydrolase
MKDLSYRTVRSLKRRTLTITVERDQEVVVRAPVAMSDDEVRRCVDTKREWIFEKLRSSQKYQAPKHPPGKEVVNGESAPYLGRDYRIVLTETQSGAVEFVDAFMVPPAQQTRRRSVLRDWYIAQAKETILSRAEQHAREMGVSFTTAKVVHNRYRWGSCTVRDSVNFNWRLIKAPMFVIDYVIVHELAHLIEGNHTTAFWSIVRARTPTMDKARAWLREHGQMLEEEI